MTTFFPSRGIPYQVNNAIMPMGVQETGQSTPPLNNFPVLMKENPSTSLSAGILFITALVSMCLGRGSCTNIPSIEESLEYLLITLNSSSCEVSSGNLSVIELIPTSWQALSLYF